MDVIYTIILLKSVCLSLFANLGGGGGEGEGERQTDGRERGTDGRMGGGRDVYYGMGSYGMEWVHNRESKGSRATS